MSTDEKLNPEQRELLANILAVEHLNRLQHKAGPGLGLRPGVDDEIGLAVDRELSERRFAERKRQERAAAQRDLPNKRAREREERTLAHHYQNATRCLLEALQKNCDFGEIVDSFQGVRFTKHEHCLMLHQVEDHFNYEDEGLGIEEPYLEGDVVVSSYYGETTIDFIAEYIVSLGALPQT